MFVNVDADATWFSTSGRLPTKRSSRRPSQHHNRRSLGNPCSRAPTAASATPAATATAPGYLYAALGRPGVLLVEHIERRQADVCDFFLAKRDLVTRSKVRRLRYVGRRYGRC